MSSIQFVLPEPAAMLTGIHEARAKVLARVEALVEAHPLHPVLTSMPAVGVRTAARIFADVVGKNFPTAGHLASYAGPAPVTWRSGSSIRGDHA
jgi:transposase